MNLLFIVINFLSFIYYSSTDIPSLPYCHGSEPGLVIVSTLDGKLSALNSVGSLMWTFDTGPGPLLLSNIHNLELTNNGEWIRIIPSLTGGLYKFDGSTVDPIPITTEELLKSSFKYSDDLVIAGSIDVRTYGIGFQSGIVYYECTSLKCSNLDDQRGEDDLLILERMTHTIRAVEPRNGQERWNFSVGLHDIKLSKISCIYSNTDKVDWNVSAILPDGILKVSFRHNDVNNKWNHVFTSPIVRVWIWSGKNMSEIDLFVPGHSPSIYLGMHEKQLYIHESSLLQNAILNRRSGTNIVVAESKSIAKIPWKPIAASTTNTEEDSTALSVLNASEYVNGQGFYLHAIMEEQLLSNNSNKKKWLHIEPGEMTYLYYLMTPWYWRELILMTIPLITAIFLLRNHFRDKQKVIFVEKPVPVEVPTKLSEGDCFEQKEQFSSRYVNQYDTVRCLGKGGFGVVFEVKHKYDDCSYAIKRITLPKKTLNRDRVMREVKALAKLEHQNIVRYFCSWVESPPVSWQQEYDKQWIKEHDYEPTVTVTPTTKSPPERVKSHSISIDDLLPRFYDSEISNAIQKKDDDDDDDDSFVVFEDSNPNARNDSGVTEPSVSEKREQSYSEHLRKKIDWKRPDRKHYSWDYSQSQKIKINTEQPVFLYIQMQLCKKENLKDWLMMHQSRDYKLIINIFSQILDAVDYVHLKGLIHRDLKPSNIFFSLDGQVKVGDFGLVKDAEDAFDLELIKKGSSPYRGHTVEVGTQLYMSPEQFGSNIYDCKVDIYSLGLILFELLVPCSTGMERIKTLTDVKQSIYPPWFEEKYANEHMLLENMLCVDPNKRLSTVGIKARPPFSRQDSGFSEDYHYRLVNFQKN
ncbi:eukaryotic translation initiation factor 2-alpha kinase [Diabrotica undecimpunctata]|uniref:eukaryotic translation initiation factor 2-alpha kinase n=1 Tax=Diabrotica undecimpunctata TaxID=50387 RepID=UPI003B6409E5